MYKSERVIFFTIAVVSLLLFWFMSGSLNAANQPVTGLAAYYTYRNLGVAAFSLYFACAPHRWLKERRATGYGPGHFFGFFY